ncbi:MAG TPA: DegT/DnrJ/EryC1/StrS family aminotransferase [Burkholderiales bacterium]|nr:DegT/DnrJ/EryC1/StrS family aminotransferase [Burkholderiales bacterium]
MQFTDLKTQYTALRQSINTRIQRVLDHGQYIMGPEVRELEERLEAYVGARHCVTVASGTEALLIALMALDVGPGDEVLTTPFTFVATAEVIVLLGAKPVFVDVEESTANIDASRIEPAITPRTKAVIPVSLYGQPADMDEINAVATRHGIPVIEDAAQSFGATYGGRKSGNLSTIGCTSFFPSKPLGCYGDGGALFTNDDALAQAMREIRVHGQSGRYRHTRVGVGGRMDTLQCAVVLAKLDRLDWELERRIALGESYARLLAPLAPRVRTIRIKPGRTSVYGQFTVRSSERARLQDQLKAKGVPTAVHYPLPLHQQPAYADPCAGQSFPIAEALAREVVSLPMSGDLSDADQRLVVNAVEESLRVMA